MNHYAQLLEFTRKVASFPPGHNRFLLHTLQQDAKRLVDYEETPEEALHYALTTALLDGVSPTTVHLMLDDIQAEVQSIENPFTEAA